MVRWRPASVAAVVVVVMAAATMVVAVVVVTHAAPAGAEMAALARLVWRVGSGRVSVQA